MPPVDLRRLPPEWTAEDVALLQAIDDATATPVYIGYGLAPEWSDGVHAVIDEIEEGSLAAAVALELVEHMLLRLLQASIDDSDGWTVGFCERLLPLHEHAVAVLGLDAATLAERRRRFERLDWNPFEELG
jgi:hypothetical protein